MADLPAASPHADHDLLRVAEAADRGATLPTELHACPECLALHSDLVALATALPASATPVRPRDYTLTAADAARLRPTGWRRWLGAIGSPRDAVSRPLAIGLTTLGLAGLLVATVPGALPMAGTASGPAGDGAAEVEPLAIETAPAPAGGGGGGGRAPTDRLDAPAGSTDPAALDPVLVVSGAMVAGGSVLFVLRHRARTSGETA